MFETSDLAVSLYLVPKEVIVSASLSTVVEMLMVMVLMTSSLARMTRILLRTRGQRQEKPT